MATLDIVRNDTVEVISGSDRGKKGRVLRAIPDTGRVLVEHVHVVKKHLRENPQRRIKGGIAEQEASVHRSNVMLVCPSCNQPTRVAHKFEGNLKVRVCRKCGGTIAVKKK
ncbi:MAG TPA: 50S ribosomal protein L24 [Acidobacteriaceae bacterium]